MGMDNSLGCYIWSIYVSDQVDSALQEMSRVSKYFAFTISYKLASTIAPQPFQRHNLHQTIWKPVEKWRKKIEKYAKIKFA